MLYRPPVARHASRWKEDWQELEFVGKGAFGSVVKARNKLDKRIYAVKRIRLRPGQSEEKLFREVSTLSRLNHRNIVRYYTTWIEYSSSGDLESGMSSAVGSSAGTGTGELSLSTTETYSIGGGGGRGGSEFDQEQMLAIDWSGVQSPSNGHSFPSIHFTNSETSDNGSDSDSNRSGSGSGSGSGEGSDVAGSDTAGSEQSSGGQVVGLRARTAAMTIRRKGQGRGLGVGLGNEQHPMIDITAPPKLTKTLFIQMVSFYSILPWFACMTDECVGFSL